MPRIRSIHPGLWTDERIVSVSFPARLLWLGILNHADDQGVFLWKPVTLKMQILPADNVDCVALLGELAEAELIQRFEVDGKAYGAVRGFQRAQNPKKPNALYPLPHQIRCFVGATASVPNQCGTGSPPVLDGGEPDGDEVEPVPPNSEIGRLMERKGEGGKNPPPSPPQGGGTEGFAEFMALYPRKEEIGLAERAWNAAIRDASPGAILEGLRRFRFGADPPKAQQWLRAKRWADQAPAETMRPASPATDEPLDQRVKRAMFDGSGQERIPSLVRVLLQHDLAAEQAYDALLQERAAGAVQAGVVQLRGAA